MTLNASFWSNLFNSGSDFSVHFQKLPSTPVLFRSMTFAPEDERPQLIAGDNIHGAVFVQICGEYRRTHTGTSVYQLWLKSCSS